MVQSVFPRNAAGNIQEAPKTNRSLSVELALPFTILAFILISEQSPMLKMELDKIVDWLITHDYVFNTIAFIIAAIPVWMIASMIKDKMSKTAS